ncbi:hypothetical protein BX285_0894 [Streptomyces sp. 1114.5]|uniref:hypothetical protein n=1 Tax=unclassified Streptomyces TaxID=2593676 RepID=UPI000BCF1BBA|nr:MULTISPECIES: hypothetical protein [unclassified Streptomyces]RKT16555.1 hypothetical protein BX285_0894 [Streptomyces sp. 1114.5]SOB82724.1 hypothetical protein SAMN06272789_2899 [Streptomyces sp. 1331.2]
MTQQTTIDQKVLADIRTQVESRYTQMTQTAAYIEDINTAVRDSFSGAASTTFQNQIRDWLEQYALVKRDYEAFHGKLGDSGTIFNSADDHTNNLALGALGGGPGQHVEDVLNPK